MEIHDNQEKGYIAVWLTNEEQKYYDRKQLTNLLLHKANNPKCKVVFFMSGHDELYKNIKGLLLTNLKNA